MWDLTNEQIEKIRKTGKIRDHVTIFSPVSGMVTKLMTSEGKYVKEGAQLYRFRIFTGLRDFQGWD